MLRITSAFLTLLPLLLMSTPSLALEPLTHETLWLMKRVGAPAVSPDGKWVVFSVTEPAYDPKEQVSDLWIRPTTPSDAPPRRLTATKGAENGAAWSPDSRLLAFSAKREGDDDPQIYVLPLSGGEAVRVTNTPGGASSPQWRPDGRALLYESAFYPSAGSLEEQKKLMEEHKKRKYSASVYTGFPMRYWDHWLDERKPQLLVQPLKEDRLTPDGEPKLLLAGTRLLASAGYAGRAGTSGESLHAIWSPEGDAVIFLATADRHRAAYAFYDIRLWKVTASGGEPEPISEEGASYGPPQFSPDGKTLYATRSARDQFVYNLDRLAAFPWPSLGAPRLLTPRWDRSVDSFAIAPDSRLIYLLAEDAGLKKIFRLAASGGDVQPFSTAGGGAFGALSVSQSPAAPVFLAATFESAIEPPEVVALHPERGSHSPITAFNTEKAAAIDWQPLRHFWFTSKRGKRIHNMIALPPAFDPTRKYPLLVVMHGGPHNMWTDQFVLRWNYHLLAKPGFVVLLTNYTGSTGFGEEFARAIQGDPLRGPGEEINEAAAEAVRQFPFIDGARQCAAGASYGGHLANWMQATTTHYRCLISHAGLISLTSQWGTSDLIYHREVGNGGPFWEGSPIWREQSPATYAKQFKTPILLTIGEKDYRVPLNQTLENWSILQRLQVPSKLVVFHNANHWILNGEDSRFFYQEVEAWLRKHLLE